MRIIALVLAVLMPMWILVSCAKEPDIVTIPGYQIHMNVNGIWSVAEESNYDLERNAGDLQIRAVAHMVSDFAEPFPAEKLYASHNEELQSLYASLKLFVHVDIWKLFLLGIPGQLAVLLWFRMYTKSSMEEKNG